MPLYFLLKKVPDSIFNEASTLWKKTATTTFTPCMYIRCLIHSHYIFSHRFELFSYSELPHTRSPTPSSQEQNGPPHFNRTSVQRPGVRAPLTKVATVPCWPLLLPLSANMHSSPTVQNNIALFSVTMPSNTRFSYTFIPT